MMKAKVQFNAVFEPAEEGGYVAYIPEYPGVNTQGETLAEAKKNLVEALALFMRVCRNTYKPSKNRIKEPLQFVA
jgi:predicted RNase H-like HicB family nuclease